MQVAMNEQFGVLAQFLPTWQGESFASAEMPVETPKGAYRVLIMEGSDALARLLATGLSAESLSVEVVRNPASVARQLERRSYQLMILDLDQPDMDGLATLRTLRAEQPEMHILVLSGRTGVEGLVAAFDHGADEYLIKPFSLLEMMARVRALRRRSAPPVQVVTPAASKLVLHREQCRAERDGRVIDLTPREFALLDFMMQHAGKTLSRAMLTQQVWNMEVEGNTNIVDVYVKYLRDKLDGGSSEKLIRTVRGMGYMLQIQP